MNKITSIKIKYADGSYSDPIPISVLADSVDWDDEGHSIADIIGTVDINTVGTLQDQINNKINFTDLSDYVNNRMAEDVADWLSTNVSPLKTVVADKTLSISGAAAEAVTVKNELDLKLNKDEIEKIESLSTGEVKFNRPQASNVKYSVSMQNGNIIMNGQSNVTRLRVIIYGDNNLWCTTDAPSYKESRAYIYHDPIESFIIGHTIQINIQLISGEYQSSQGSPSIAFWNKANDNALFSGLDGTTWVVTDKPELIALCIYKGTYNDAVFKVTIKDLTILEQHPITSFIKSSIDKVNDKIIDLKNELKGKDIEFESKDGQSPTLPISKNGKYITINGELTVENNRVRIYGDFATSTNAPTLTNCADWYGDPIDTFIIGHNIKVEAKLVSGDYDLVGYQPIYFDFRNRTDGVIIQPNSGTSFKIEKIPEMICVGFKAGIYNNAVFEIKIIDILEHTFIQEFEEIKSTLPSINYKVPEFFQAQLERAIERINHQTKTNDNSSNASDYDAFIFITDPHWGRNKRHSPALIKAIIENTPVQTVICGGDIISSHSSTKQGAVNQLKSWENAIKGTGVNEYYCIFGNHDDNSNGSNTPISVQFSKQQLFGLLYGSFAYQNNIHWAPYINWADYYVDHAISKTRYICLDWTGTQSSGDRQQWLRNVLEIDDGYRVLIFHHGVYQYASNLTTYPDGIAPSSKLAILTAITDQYPNKVKAIIQGHVHLDGLYLPGINGFNHNSPIMITSCDTYQNQLGPFYTLTQETIDQQCFDVVVVNYAHSKIYTTRIGRFGWEPDKEASEIMNREFSISTD